MVKYLAINTVAIKVRTLGTTRASVLLCWVAGNSHAVTQDDQATWLYVALDVSPSTFIGSLSDENFQTRRANVSCPCAYALHRVGVQSSRHENKNDSQLHALADLSPGKGSPAHLHRKYTSLK